MTQSKEDLENIKSKIIEHIKKTYDEQKATEFISNIELMADEQFIEFLKQQGLLKDDGEPTQNSKCIFCSMIFGEIPTTKIGENDKAIAILELNPISQGHCLIIPKEHIEDKEKIPKEAYDLAKDIGEKIIKTFKPKDIKIVESEVMGHQMINVLPVYDNETMESPRTKQTPEGLAELKKRIEETQSKQIAVSIPSENQIESPEEISAANTWLPRRIP